MIYPNQTFTDTLPAGSRLSLTLTGTGLISFTSPSGAVANFSLTASRAFGPFQNDQGYKISCLTGTVDVTESVADGVNDMGSLASLATDTSGNVTGLVGPGGVNIGMPVPTKITDVPYLMASFGDSRSAGEPSIFAPDFNVTSSYFRATRFPVMFMGAMGDVEYCRNYGVGGDTCAAWASTTRAISGGVSGSASITNLINETVDFVSIQYGINDIVNWDGATPALGTFVTTQIAYHKAYIAEILKSGKKVVWESINPCTSAGYGSAAATKKTAVDQINAGVRDFLGNFTMWTVYADTATSLKASDGYANSAYYADGVHFNRTGALLSGRLVAAAARQILPKKPAISYGASPARPNFIDWITPAVYTVAETGSVSGLVTTTGVENGEFYIQHVYTPTAGARFRAATNGHVGTATPRYALSIGDVVQGSARIVVDDGSGGAPNASAIDMRHRMYGASGVFQSTGELSNLTLTPLTGFDQRVMTPRVASQMASASIADVGLSQGYALEVFVTSPSTAPVRVRIYSPQLRRVA